MLKLQKDKKIIKNVKIPKGKYKVIGTSSIIIFATLLGTSYLNINPKTILVDQKEYESTPHINVNNECTYTYEDYLIEQCEDKVFEYAPIFNIDNDILLEIAIQNIKDYGSVYICNKDYNSLDTEVILLCKDILKNYTSYGLEYADVITTREYVPTLTIREMVYKYADLFNVDRTMALSISCLESNDFKTPIATEKNNPFAIKATEFLIFDNLEEGIIEGVLNLKRGYIDMGLDTYEEMERVYCPGSEGHWLSLAYDKQYKLENGLLQLYDEPKKLAMGSVN